MKFLSQFYFCRHIHRLLFLMGLLLFALSACTNSSNEDTTINTTKNKDKIENLIKSEDVIRDKYGKIVILKSESCEALDCQKAFENYKNQVHFFSKSEIFIYNFKGYIEIESIDEDSIAFKKIEWK